MSEPACPLCAGATLLKRWGEVAGFRCQGCDANFIRGRPLEEFLADHHRPRDFTRLLEKARESPSSVRNLKCPDCRTQSYRTANLSTLAIDICATCGGLFFDRGEADAWFTHLLGRREPAGTTDFVSATDDVGHILFDILT